MASGLGEAGRWDAVADAVHGGYCTGGHWVKLGFGEVRVMLDLATRLL